MIPPEAVERYRKVKALADRGVEGEQANALRQLAIMRDKYPGIEHVAFPPPPPPPPRHNVNGSVRQGARHTHQPIDPRGLAGFPDPATPPWAQFAAGAAQFFVDAARHAQRDAAIQQALSQGVDCRSRFNTQGDMLVTVKIPPCLLLGVLDAVTGDMNGDELIAQFIGGLAAGEFLECLEEARHDAQRPGRR